MRKEKEKQTGKMSASLYVPMDLSKKSLCLAIVAAVFCWSGRSRALADAAGRGPAFLRLGGTAALALR